MSDSLAALLTALADDELIIGHRHSEWTGFAPHIEEDVAFSSIAQDEIGHAAAYYTRLSRLGRDSDADRLALGKDAVDYRNAIICERPNGDWSYTLARHWLYDAADSVRLEALESSADHELAALATKMRREERYHLLHADTWMKRVAAGPVEGRTLLIASLGSAFAESAGLFEPIEEEEAAIEAGWLPAPSHELRARFLARTAESLENWGLPAEVHAGLDRSAEFVASSSGDLIAGRDRADVDSPVASHAALGGRRGHHSEDFKTLWDDMTSTFRSNPGAAW